MKFKELLKEKRYTPMAISKLLNVKPQTVYRWTYGDCRPRIETMLEIAKILEVSEKEIIDVFKKD